MTAFLERQPFFKTAHAETGMHLFQPSMFTPNHIKKLFAVRVHSNQ